MVFHFSSFRKSFVARRRPSRRRLTHALPSVVSAGKNWDFTAALSDFEQLRQVHAGTLTHSGPEDRALPLPDRDMARVGRPLLHRQSEAVQGEPVFRQQAALGGIPVHAGELRLV